LTWAFYPGRETFLRISYLLTVFGGGLSPDIDPDTGDSVTNMGGKRFLSRGKKPRSVFLREEGFEPGLEKSRTVRIYL
jgi:hypothetical protein